MNVKLDESKESAKREDIRNRLYKNTIFAIVMIFVGFTAVGIGDYLSKIASVIGFPFTFLGSMLAVISSIWLGILILFYLKLETMK